MRFPSESLRSISARASSTSPTLSKSVHPQGHPLAKSSMTPSRLIRPAQRSSSVPYSPREHFRFRASPFSSKSSSSTIASSSAASSITMGDVRGGGVDDVGDRHAGSQASHPEPFAGAGDGRAGCAGDAGGGAEEACGEPPPRMVRKTPHALIRRHPSWSMPRPRLYDYVIDETIELWRFNYGGKSLVPCRPPVSVSNTDWAFGRSSVVRFDRSLQTRVSTRPAGKTAHECGDASNGGT